MSNRKFKKVQVTVTMIYEQGNENLAIYNVDSLQQHLSQLVATEQMIVSTDLFFEKTLSIEEADQEATNLNCNSDTYLGIKKTIILE